MTYDSCGQSPEQELAGKLAEARQLLQRGCELCPTSEDIWLESARLQSPENGRAILARGVAAIPTSVKLWLQVSTFLCPACYLLIFVVLPLLPRRTAINCHEGSLSAFGLRAF